MDQLFVFGNIYILFIAINALKFSIQNSYTAKNHNPLATNLI